MTVSRREALEEIARRSAKRDLLSFMRWCWWMPHPFIVGRHTRKICARLTQASDDWRNGISTYLLIEVPFRHGKSDIVSRAFPAWFLGANADRQPDFIMSGYGVSLVRGFSKRVKRIMESLRYQLLFPCVLPARGSNKAEEWAVDGSSGAVTAQGLGGALTGKGGHCVTGETLVITPFGKFKIDCLFRLSYRGLVLSYNHLTGKPEWRMVVAGKESTREDILKIRTAYGRQLRCTSDHRVLGNGRYKPAQNLGERDSLRTVQTEQDMRPLWSREGKGRASMPSVLPESQTVNRGRTSLHVMREGLPAQALRSHQVERQGMHRPLLFRGVFKVASRNQKTMQVHHLRQAGREEAPEVLRGMQEDRHEDVEAGGVRLLRLPLPAQDGNVQILHDAVQEQGSQSGHERRRQPAFHRWLTRLPGVVRSDGAAHLRKGFRAVLSLFGRGRASGSSYRREYSLQRSVQPDHAVPFLPHEKPQVGTDRVSRVEADSRGPEFVYDLQVEGNHNFFADGILVHNCLIVDDYCKNRREAASATYRDSTWDSFRNDLLTRANSPAAIRIVCATPWHIDDLRGRIKAEMAKNPDFPRFEELQFPASKPGEYDYLFPERFPAEWYKAQRASLGKQAAALLDCEPIVEGGNRFDTAKVVIHYTLDGWPFGRETRGWDLASSSKQRDGDDPDRTWGVRGLIKAINLGHGAIQREIWIRSIVACQDEAPARDALIRATAQADGYAVLQYVEAFGGYKDAFTILKSVLAGVSVVRASRLPGDKSAKLAALEPSFDAGLVHVYAPGCGEWLSTWLAEFGAFPDGKHDDGPDATAVMFHSQLTSGGGFVC